jgi:bifunctional non-homologous end joining protein LigD
MIAPMLCRNAETLTPSKDYIYEIKLDGQRTLAEVSRKSLLLYTRNFQVVTGKYPELEILKKCVRKPAILDGEIVALKNGIPSFELLQQRMNLKDGRAVNLAAQRIPVLYYVFDILSLDRVSLLKKSLSERKKILQKAVTPLETVKILPYFESSDLIVSKARDMGYEGVVAKRANSEYLPGQRTDLWLKYKFQRTESFVIGGWIEGGRSQSFGSLLIGQYDGKRLIHCGRAGTGFNDATIRMLMEKFQQLETRESPFVEVSGTREIIHWLKPKLVAEVRFNEWTAAGIVRAPVYCGLRDDVKPRDCKVSR